MNRLSGEYSEAFADSIDKMLARAEPSRSGAAGGFATERASLWKGIADLGLIGMRLGERAGGLGLSAQDLVTTMQAFGRHLVVEPYLATAVLGSGVARAVDIALDAGVLESVIAGQTKLSLAYAEPRSRYNPCWVETAAVRRGQDYVLRGAKTMALGAADADILFVTARTSGNPGDRDGISLFRVPSNAKGVTIQRFTTVDGRAAADVQFDDVALPDAHLVGAAGGALPTIERILDEAALAVCAESVGIMHEVNRLAIDHCRTREAFGQALSGMQVVQHRLVDMHVAAEYASAIVDAAAIAIDGDEDGNDPIARGKAVSAAKVIVARDGYFIATAAVQLHGAIGTTEELSIGRYLKRIIANSVLFGDADFHRKRFRELRYAIPKRTDPN